LPAPRIDWIRVLYAYPGYVTDRLIDVIASQPQILPYLDMPLQHAHRKHCAACAARQMSIGIPHPGKDAPPRCPTWLLRSTFIVGYPGETEEEFLALLKFIDEIRFDRVGTFQFSFEPGTGSETLGDPIPAEVKQERYDRLMERQQAISLEKNQAFVGQTLDVLVEGYGDGIAVGRSYRDAPEIDGWL